MFVFKVKVKVETSVHNREDEGGNFCSLVTRANKTSARVRTRSGAATSAGGEDVKTSPAIG